MAPWYPCSLYLHSSAEHFHSLCLPRKSNSGLQGPGDWENWLEATCLSQCGHITTSLSVLCLLCKRTKPYCALEWAHFVSNLPLAKKLTLSACRGPQTPHLNPVRGSPVGVHYQPPRRHQKAGDLEEGF